MLLSAKFCVNLRPEKKPGKFARLQPLIWRRSLDFKHTDVTELIIKAFYTVYHTLGYGFLEKVYRNAMVIELANWDWT